MRATIEADWLRRCLYRWQGAITITDQTVFENWWGEPYKGPVGLAGRPEGLDAFVAVRAEGADVYVARGIWEQLAGRAGRLHVLMPGYGMAWFRFDHEDEESILWTEDGVRSFTFSG